MNERADHGASAAAAPARIVSLVPSLTETLVSFGLLDSLVGRTRYCVEPAGTVECVEMVGGTKNPDVTRVVALAPDLVIVNKEENRREDAEALRAAGLRVHVTHPRTVAEAADMLAELGRVCGAPRAGDALAAECRGALARTAERARARPRLSVFCPIWRNPWMTFRTETYVGSVLDAVGLDNVFGDADDAHGDFFTVDIADALARAPDVIVLPDEPYVFGRKHGEELHALGAKAEIFYVDGKDLSWYGPRIPRALERLEKITRALSRI